MLTYKEFIKESENDYWYHATYKVNKNNISKKGLLSNSPKKYWEDSKNVVYLAKNPDTALSYAETSEDVPDKHYNSGIVVYKIHKKHLDKTKLNPDSNVRNEDNDTAEYHGDIHPEHLEIHSEHET
jgi:hypothetical protein